MSSTTAKSSIVWRVLRYLLALAILVCLVKLAFFPSQESLPAASPGGNYETPISQASQGSIDNTMNLDATVMPDPASRDGAAAGPGGGTSATGSLGAERPPQR